MARIPTGAPETTLGNVIAPAQRATSVDPRAFGVGIAAEAERMTGQALAAGQQQEAQAVAEQQRQLQQEEAERLQREREAKRVAAVTAQARIANGLADIEDDIARGMDAGEYRKEEAGELWQARSKELLDTGLEEVDRQNRPLVEAALLDNVGRSRRTVGKMVEQRTRAEISQGAAQYLEEVSRYAARGDTQADEAIRAVEAFIPSVAGRAGIDAQRTVQGFKERVRFRQASDLMLADPAGTIKRLRDPDTFPELDPDKRAVLIARGEADLERRQRRAELEAERIAREQERVFQGAAAIFESGRAFNAEYADQMLARLKGSPYEASIRQMIEIGPQNVAAATLPIQQQRAQLDALLAKVNTEGTSPAMNREIERRQKVLKAAESDIRQDPLGAALERGVVPALPPINVTNLQALPQALAERVQAAAVAGQWAGAPASPLRAEEAEQIGRMLAPLPPEQKASALAAIGAAVGDREQIGALAKQIDAKDKTLATAMMYANTKTSRGRHVSELILRGQQALRDGKVKEDRAKETGWRAAIADEIGNAYPNEELRARMVDAAYMVQVGLASEGSPDVAQAVRLATGGVMTQADESKVPLPYGWTEREVRDGLRSYPVERLPAEMRAGAAPLTREQLRERLPDAILVHAGPGRYAIRAGQGFVTDAAGRRVVIDLPGSAR